MHGVKKLKTTEDKERERKAENRKTIEKYLGHLRTVIAKSQSKSFDEEGLRESASALTISPDSNVLWNYRKVALLAFGPEERQSRGVAELTLLEQCIRANTKSYWVWFHRKWVAENLLPTSMDWQRELGLCNKLLDLDSRNFHCWNYRRFVGMKLDRSDAEELAFTEQKIRQNFSNYSAWHQRSFLLTRIHDGKPAAEFEAALRREFEFVRNALYVEPSDQSGWIYIDWLVGNMLKLVSGEKVKDFLGQELEECKKLLEIEPDSKWATLTCVKLLNAKGDPDSKRQAAPLIEKLKAIDPAHSSYYEFLSSR